MLLQAVNFTGYRLIRRTLQRNLQKRVSTCKVVVLLSKSIVFCVFVAVAAVVSLGLAS